MADVAVARKTGKKQKTAQKKFAPHTIPIEKRTDVTVDELEKLSLPYPAELYNGRVVYKMANYAHGLIQVNLGAELKIYLRQNPIGHVLSETNFKLWPNRPKESRIPDIAFLKKERLPDDPYRFPDMAPDLAIEIISPDDSFSKVMKKVDAYLEQGAELVWLVFAETREVLVCTKESKYSVRDILTASDLLPGFELPVERIFEGIEQPEKATS